MNDRKKTSIMANFSFNRTIPISPLYREVLEWRRENGTAGVGFTKLTTELCDLFSRHDPDWIGEGGWTDALDQYVYVEYIMLDPEGRPHGVRPFVAGERQGIPDDNAKVSLRSCEDDLCLEILASDMMVRYCVAEQRSEELWALVVRETAIMSVLYDLNGKGDAFWKELLHLNKTLGVIDEQPVVRVFLGDVPVLSFAYSPDIPLPSAQTNDFMQLDAGGGAGKYFVEERTFCHEHPFGKLGEIHIRLFQA